MKLAYRLQTAGVQTYNNVHESHYKPHLNVCSTDKGIQHCIKPAISYTSSLRTPDISITPIQLSITEKRFKDVSV